jgi:hypothetical protein
MEQRPLRLGDIVDDYCPRERRLTNHAVVAIVDQTIRQTRCTTCDAEHVYKDGRVPRRRRREDADAGGGLSGGQLVMPRPLSDDADIAANPEETGAGVDTPEPVAAIAEAPLLGASAAEDAVPTPVEAEAASSGADSRDSWPAHRQLIRATLPRPIDGEAAPARPIPEFTMHQRPQGRSGFRQGHGWYGGGSGRNGNSPERNGNVMPGQGHGGGGGRHRRRGRHKRSR